MTPWRKRFEDLRKLIEQAEGNYFEPDIFRLNVNNAIQTARTVTFLIQKNKGSVKDFDGWYKNNVLDRLKGDRVMEWLKESRNHIEKEGDLDVNSKCTLETIFSYTDPGPKLSLKDGGFLFIGTKKLIRAVRKIFPTGIYRESAIAIDRRWIATTLPDIELTDALHYGFTELARIVQSLDEHIGRQEAPPATMQGVGRGSASRRSYLKTDDGHIYSYRRSQHALSPTDIKEIEGRYELTPFAEAFRSTADLKVAVERFSDLAGGSYSKDGYHVTILFTLDAAGELSGIIGPQFDDRVDKLIFWSELAQVAKLDRRIAGVVFISEIWMRSMDGFPQKSVSQLDITGEALQITAANRDVCFIKTIPIVDGEGGKRLDLGASELEVGAVPNFLVPLRRVWETR